MSSSFPFLLLLTISTLFFFPSSSSQIDDPKPTPWPHQFHSILFMNHSGIVQMIDLWYDWPNGRNFNMIRHQLGNLLYDLEWNNGTSFFYTLDSNKECHSVQLEVGLLTPNWMDGANFLGQRHVDGFLCNVWEKADFIWYYEDAVSKRPVHWVFYTGREAHVITFEVGAVLEDEKWQAPAYCFQQKNQNIQQPTIASHQSLLDEATQQWGFFLQRTNRDRPSPFVTVVILFAGGPSPFVAVIFRFSS